MGKEKNTKVTMDPFQEWSHSVGRIGTVIALIYMVAIPFIVLTVYDAMPTLGDVFNLATFSILLIYIPVGISEAISYTPVLGSSILALAALLSSRISFVFEIPQVKTASNYIIPALFGSLTLGLFSSGNSGSKIVKHGIKGVIPVLVIVSVLSLVVRITSGGSLFGAIGFLIIAMLPIAIITSRILWKKGIITVEDNPAMVKKEEKDK